MSAITKVWNKIRHRSSDQIFIEERHLGPQTQWVIALSILLLLLTASVIAHLGLYWSFQTIDASDVLAQHRHPELDTEELREVVQHFSDRAQQHQVLLDMP